MFIIRFFDDVAQHPDADRDTGDANDGIGLAKRLRPLR